MNTIYLKGVIRNIEYSHSINDVDYDKADLIVKRDDGEDDIISLRFKKYSNIYQENDEIELAGNIRSYSHQLENGKNKVDIYVFTYFDLPDTQEDLTNRFELSGRICKIDPIHVSKNGKQNIHLVLANNIISADGKSKINTYFPIVAWGNVAKFCTTLNISDEVKITGQLHSRTYKKYQDNGDMQILTAHEGVALQVDKLED